MWIPRYKRRAVAKTKGGGGNKSFCVSTVLERKKNESTSERQLASSRLFRVARMKSGNKTLQYTEFSQA